MAWLVCRFVPQEAPGVEYAELAGSMLERRALFEAGHGTLDAFTPRRLFAFLVLTRRAEHGSR